MVVRYKKRVDKGPEKLDAILDQSLLHLGLDTHSPIFLVKKHWVDIVGERLVDMVKADKVIDGELVIGCRDCNYAGSVNLLRKTLLARINEHVPEAGITSISVRMK